MATQLFHRTTWDQESIKTIWRHVVFNKNKKCGSIIKNGYIQKSRLFEFHILEQSKKVELLKKVDFFAQIQKSRLLLSKKVDFSQMSKKVDFF